MSIQVDCPNPECGDSRTIADEEIGNEGRCHKCGRRFSFIPGTRPAASRDTEADFFPVEEPERDLPNPFGRYQILQKLGQGGMGTVYLAHDTQLDCPVALKVPLPRFGDVPEVRDRLFREARVAARFHHPNFCRIFDINQIDGVHYLALAYIEGETLAQLLARDHPLPQRRAAEIVRTLARALAEAHREKIIHRDLKPANVMIDRRGVLVIMDFGLARRAKGVDLSLTVPGAVMGTLAYMPPEQVEGDQKTIGPGSDIYSLGVIFYELLTGQRPFQGDGLMYQILAVPPISPSAHRPGLDPRLEAACLKAMSKQSADRYPTMDAFADSLDAALAPSQAPPMPAPEPARPLPKPSPLVSSGFDFPPDKSRPPRWRAAALVAAALLALFVVLRIVSGTAANKSDPNNSMAAAPVAPPAPMPLRSLTNSVGMKLVLIPAGEFQMGSPDSDTEADPDEKPQHRVRITRPFYLGATEVTQGQYRAVTGANPSDFKGSDDLPVEQVSWDEAIAFCDKLSEKEGMKPYYQFGAGAVSGGPGYRLPTEAEWEYACRAGSPMGYGFGDDAAQLDEYAWYGENSDGKTHPIGRKRSNAFGLYDMHGNVWEWCWDWEGAYAPSPATEPSGTSKASNRVLRGGSWSNLPKSCRPANRSSVGPGARNSNLGLRLARGPFGP